MSAASKNTIEFPAPGVDQDASGAGSSPQVSMPVSWEIPVRIYGARGTVVVSGRTQQTEPFLEETNTLILFPQGAVVRLAASVAAGQSLLVTNENSNREVLSRVVSVRAAANGLAYVEFEFTNPQDSFWGAHCPSENPAPERAPTAAAAPPPARAVAPAPPARPAAPIAAPPPTPPAAQRSEPRPKATGSEPQNPARRREQAPREGLSIPVSEQITSSPIAPQTPQSSRDVWNESFPSKALKLDTVVGPPDPAEKRKSAGNAEERKATKPGGNFITPTAIGAISAAADSVISAEMHAEAPAVDTAPPPAPPAPHPVQTYPASAPKERAPRTRIPQEIASQVAGIPASQPFGAPRGAGLRSAPAAASAEPSPRAIGDSLGNLEDWKTPPAIPAASGRSYRQMDFGGQSTARADHYGMVTQVEEERDPKRLWIFVGMGIGVLIIVSILMFSGGPEKPVANTNTPGTDQVSALQPPKPPSVWDAKSYVSTTRSNLATPPSKKPEQSDDLFLSDSPAPAKTTAREETNSEPPARARQQRQPAQIEKRDPAPPPVARTPAPRPQPPASSLPDSTLRKLSTQPAVPERSVEQSRVRQSAAAPPEVRESPPSAPQNGMSGISPASAPAAEAPAPPPAPAPVATSPAPSQQHDEAGRQPLRVGGKIKAPQLVHSVPPQYPLMARQAHVEGDVVVDMVIEASGKVGKMNVISGPLLLRDAAIAALRQWEYRPTLLNDQPVPVQMQVLIKFKM